MKISLNGPGTLAMYLYEADFWCSSSKKHSLIIAPIYPNLDQSSGLLEAQEQERNLYKDLKLFLKPFKSTWKLSWSWEKAITGQTWFHADSNPSTAHWYQIHMQRNFWKLFSLNRPWDSDLEVVSCVAGGIIWCLIKTGSVSALDTSSPSSLLPALSQFPWIKSQLGLHTTRQGGGRK